MGPGVSRGWATFRFATRAIINQIDDERWSFRKFWRMTSFAFNFPWVHYIRKGLSNEKHQSLSSYRYHTKVVKLKDLKGWLLYVTHSICKFFFGISTDSFTLSRSMIVKTSSICQLKTLERQQAPQYGRRTWKLVSVRKGPIHHRTPSQLSYEYFVFRKRVPYCIKWQPG